MGKTRVRPIRKTCTMKIESKKKKKKRFKVKPDKYFNLTDLKED